MFRNASYVLTGTFHGTVFSLLNHRQFVCFLKNPSRIQKVGSLLKEFGLSDRQCEGKAKNMLSTMKQPIDYEAVQKIFDRRKAESLDFIKESILVDK